MSRRARLRRAGSARAPSCTTTVIGDGAVVGARCELRRGVRVWPDVVLPDGVRFSPDV